MPAWRRALRRAPSLSLERRPKHVHTQSTSAISVLRVVESRWARQGKARQGTSTQISTSDKTHARTEPDRPQARPHKHSRNTVTHKSHTTDGRHHSPLARFTHTSWPVNDANDDDTALLTHHTHSATTACERERLGDHRLCERHRSLHQRLRPHRDRQQSHEHGGGRQAVRARRRSAPPSSCEALR